MKIKNEKRFLWIFWGCITTPILIISILLVLISFGAFGKLPTFEELENPKSNISTEIISEDGVLLGSFFVENRSFVEYGDLSAAVVAALVSTEDSRYYSHAGIDFKGLMRVAVKTIALGQSQGGGSTISQQLAKNLYPRDTTTYGSSIARTGSLVIAKLKEWITASMLEYNYTKEEIIAMYLNIVPYGSNAFGIKSAAKTFFGKELSQLNVEEAATLVGVVNAPTKYSPVRNYERSLTRRNLVISRMESSGFLRNKQADSIINTPIELNYQPISHNQGTSTYFRAMVSRYMTANEPKRSQFLTQWDYEHQVKQWNTNPLYGWCNKNTKIDGTNYNLYRDGLKIYTTVNSKMQQYAEEAVYETMKNTVQPMFNAQKKGAKSVFSKVTPEEINKMMKSSIRQTERYRVLKNIGFSEEKIIKNFNEPTEMNLFSYSSKQGIDTVMTPYDSIMYCKSFLRAGFTAIEPSSGYVKAYVGGVDFKYFKYDMASQGKRHAGSTFKPFIYTFALDQLGMSPCEMIPNLPTTIEGWSPKEAGKVEYDGVMHPLWWGLANSRNNYSSWIMKQANQPQAVADFVHRLGINSFIDPVPSMCLGAVDATVMEMVSAYTNYVNMGVHIEPIFVTRIEDRHGNILASFSPQSIDVISEQSAYNMLEILQQVVNRGTGGRLRYMYKFTGEMGGKTGTTDNNSDTWFIGVTPKIIAGTWVGGEDRSIHLNRGEGASVALPVFGAFMSKCYADPSAGLSEKDVFVRPAGVKRFDCEGTGTDIDQGVTEDSNDDDFFNR